MTYKLHTLIYDLSSEDYHGTKDTFSSSQFKDLLEGDKMFVEKHVKRTIEREHKAVFDVGTFLHTSILEPHKLKSECVVYEGGIRIGKRWEEFKIKNKRKTIITKKEKEQVDGMTKAVQDSVIAGQYLEGEVEVSLFTEINIHNGRIYAPYFGKELTLDGWTDGPKKRIDGARKVIVKVRADVLSDTYISDLKSTAGDAESDESIHASTKRYKYELSAALYLDMFRLLRPKLMDFYLIFASKEMFNCRTYEVTPDKIKVGRGKYMKALRRYAELAKINFESTEQLGYLRPLPEEFHWMQESDRDLL